jgi:hypothetical protein
MRFVFALILVALMVGGLGAWQPPAPSASKPAQSSNQEINDRFAKQILDRIAGHEKEPAEQVFKNIQWFKGTPGRASACFDELGL